MIAMAQTSSYSVSRPRAEAGPPMPLVIGIAAALCYVTTRGKVCDLGPLRNDVERQERALHAAWSLGNTTQAVPGGSHA